MGRMAHAIHDSVLIRAMSRLIMRIDQGYSIFSLSASDVIHVTTHKKWLNSAQKRKCTAPMKDEFEAIRYI